MSVPLAVFLALAGVTVPCQDSGPGPLFRRVAISVRWLSPYLQLFEGPFAYKHLSRHNPASPIFNYELAAYAYATFCVCQADSRTEEVSLGDWLQEGAKSRADRTKLWKEHFGDLEYALSQLRPELETPGAWGPFERDRATVRTAFRKQGVELQPMPEPKLFPDVAKDHWAALEVFKLRKLGILNGYPDGRFRG